MPFGIQGYDSLVSNGLGTAFATVRVLGQVAFLAEGSALDIHKLGAD